MALLSHSVSAQLATVEVVTPDSPARPGEAYEVRLEYAFEGPSNAVALGPPRIPEVDWGIIALREARGEVRDGRHRIVQVLDVMADSEGTYTVESMASPYLDPSAPPIPAETGPDEVPAAPELPEISVPSFTIEVRKGINPVILYGGIGAGILVVVGGLVALYRSRGRAPAPRAASPVNAEAARNALHTARKHRLDGDYYSFFVVLRSGAEAFRHTADGAVLHRKLDEWANRTGYGGGQPSNEDVEGTLRDYERALQQIERDAT